MDLECIEIVEEFVYAACFLIHFSTSWYQVDPICDSEEEKCGHWEPHAHFRLLSTVTIRTARPAPNCYATRKTSQSPLLQTQALPYQWTRRFYARASAVLLQLK